MNDLERAARAVDGVCCGCGYSGEEETPCETRDDHLHCVHWYEGPSPATPPPADDEALCKTLDDDCYCPDVLPVSGQCKPCRAAARIRELRAENERLAERARIFDERNQFLEPEVYNWQNTAKDCGMMCYRLIRALERLSPNNILTPKAREFLNSRTGVLFSALREEMDRDPCA